MRDFGASEEGARPVGVALGFGVLLLPLVFSWFTLRPGYSKLARIVALGWLAVTFSPALIWTYTSLAGQPSKKEIALADAPAPQPAVGKGKLPVKSAIRNVPEQADTGAPASNWKYYKTKDEMRNTVTDVATISSTDTIDFGFPYGASPGTLTLITFNRPGLDWYRVRLQVNGQFDLASCEDYGCKILMKLDDGPIQSFTFGQLPGHPPGALEADIDAPFIEALKAASILRVEAVYYQAGHRQLRFDVKGLQL